MNEFVKYENNKWKPDEIKWNHPKLLNYLYENYREENDLEIARKFSEWTGKNISKKDIQKRRLELNLRKQPSKSKSKKKIAKRGLVDWDSKEVHRFFKVYHRKLDDIELAKKFNEKFNTNLAWASISRKRRAMGYTRGGKDTAPRVEIGGREMRRCIYRNHPDYGGRCNTLSGVTAEFVKNFSEFKKVSPLVVLKKIRAFIESDETGEENLFLEWHKVPLGKVGKFLD